MMYHIITQAISKESARLMLENPTNPLIKTLDNIEDNIHRLVLEETAKFNKAQNILAQAEEQINKIIEAKTI